MFTSLEKFYSDYRIQNGQQPNETVLNRGLMRLKREIRELKSVQDIIRNVQIASWNENTIYEQDEYVYYKGLIYKSLIDANYNDIPDKTDSWEVQSIETVEDKNLGLKSNTFISKPNQVEFKCDYTFPCKPVVFMDGILQDIDTYDYRDKSVFFKEPCTQNRTVVILTSVAYESTLVLPKREFITSKDNEYEFELGFRVVYPEVFVNGVLLPNSKYSYTNYTVELEDPVPKGTVVTIENGSTVGFDLYTKKDLDDAFSKIYTKDETYNKTEVDNSLNKKVDYVYAETTYAKQSNVYDKNYINKLISGYVSLDEYNKGMELKADKANTISGYGIVDAYTKAETDNDINENLNNFRDGYLKNVFDLKADKAITLNGYGITDAYTKIEVDAFLGKKFDISNFTRGNIVYTLCNSDLLNADLLNNFSSDQFMRTDNMTTNEGGINIKSQISEDNIFINHNEYPNINISTLEWQTKSKKEKDQSTFKLNQKVYTPLNSNDLYYVVEGEFNGTWYSNINDFGIIYPDEYNWFVNVFPQIQGPVNDFVPADFPSHGYTISGFIEPNQEWEQTTYHFGYIINNVVKLYSWFKNGENNSAWIPMTSKYQLIGIKKDISVRRYRNQGDDTLAYYQFNSNNDEENEILKSLLTNKKIDRTTPKIPDIKDEKIFWYSKKGGRSVDLNATARSYKDRIYRFDDTKREIYNELVVKANKYKITNDEYVYVYARYIDPEAPLIWDVTGDGEIIEKSDFSDVSGNAYCVVRGKQPYETEIRVTCTGSESGSDYCIINNSKSYKDDPDTTFMFEGSDTFDNTVFTVTDSDSLNKDDPDSTIIFDVNDFDDSVFTFGS